MRQDANLAACPWLQGNGFAAFTGVLTCGWWHRNARRAEASPPADPANETRDRLVMEHVALVKTLAQRLAQRLPSQVEVSDLVSVGVLGLIDAATRYKPTLGVPFDAFARRRVQGAMLDSLRDLDWAPRSLRRLRRDVDARDRAAARTSSDASRRRAKSPRELSLSVAEYDKALEQLRTLEIGADPSLDAPPRTARRSSRCASIPARARRAARAEGAARASGAAPSASCPSASGRSSRSTTKRS